MADKKKRTRLNELLGMGEADLNAAAAAAHKAVYQFHKDRLSKPQENVKDRERTAARKSRAS